ncbi:MAG TPA: HAMP domain-containing sensor histidine kinase [Candidatus Paceibacterota bacterium]|nr:HAMP domain-containing sensor histidine kinase [Candidatus Paceibacterota bacterium]
MFTWSITDIFTVLIFFFSYYFLYTFLTGKDLPLWQKVAGVVLFLPTLYWTIHGSNLTSFDGNLCQATENGSVTNYPLFLEALTFALCLGLSIFSFFKSKALSDKKKAAFAGAGVSLFVFFFFFSLFLADWLVSNNIWVNAYNVEIYGLFGMPVLLILLGYLIVRYHAFNLKVFGTQALVLALWLVIGSELVFVRNTVNQVLVLVTLGFSVIFGYFLVKSVRGEIKAKEDLQKANDRLRELDVQKTEFVSFATHQLRSPLTAIKGNTSLILEGDAGPISESVKNIVQTVYISVKTMITVVEDYLNISRIELGTMKYDLRDLDFKDLLQEVVNEQKPNIESKGLTYSVSFDPNIVYKIKADPDKFKQVVMNTIDNSIKYTPSGSLTISLEKDQTKGAVRLKVADTGVGIRADVMPKLFQKFTRAPNASEANIHGTGLGLFIAKNIMDAHGGRVWAESAGEGKGSQFYIELPEAK